MQPEPLSKGSALEAPGVGADAVHCGENSDLRPYRTYFVHSDSSYISGQIG
jgi:hypothetical protein